MFRKARVKKASVSIPKRKWKSSRLQRKEWDETVSDLTVHKASEEEIQRRRIIHKSKNAGAARRALGERAKKLFMDPASPAQVELEMKKLAILKEVLYDHDDLNEVLNRVDNTMSSVKTIFHEAPYRKSGNLNVTLAPGSKANQGNGPVHIRDEPATQMSLLSDSVMDKQALNEESSSEDDYCEEDKFESKVDYERFLNVLRESLNKSVVPPAISGAGDSLMTPLNNGKLQTGFNAQALNCTEEVKRTMTRLQSQSEAEGTEYPQKKIDETIQKMTTSKTGTEPKKKQASVSFSLSETTQLPPSSLTANNMTYESLQEAMESVASNISEIENRRGNQSDTANMSVKCDGLAGFTATLIDAVTRLTVYVNEAEGKLIESESRIEELKSQNDHQRALLDALTAELMSTQEQIKSIKEDSSKQREESNKQISDFAQEMKKEMQELKDRMGKIEKHEDGAGDAASTTNSENLQIIETGISKSEKDIEEEALKSDMLSLLGALKSQNSHKSQPESQQPQAVAPIPSMNHQSSKGAAQTVASVESQLRHLQLQHAEAQNRLQELTEVAGILAGKVAESERSQSSTSSANSDPASSSSCTPSIASGPITPQQDGDEFYPMIPSHGNDETDDSISGITITSSMFANAGGDTSRPSMQSRASGQNTASPLLSRRLQDDTNSSKSIDCVNISDNSYLSLDENIPALLQSNIYGTGPSMKFGKESQPSTRNDEEKLSSLSPFRPTTYSNVPKADSQTVSNSIQQTQCNLEDRIAELNRQHAEAQSRLQNLIRKRSDIRSPSSLSSDTSGISRKIIQVTVPTDEMLKTPKIYNPPQPFKPYSLTDDSFA